MKMLRRWRELRTRRDAGFSLVEMLVAIVMLGLIMTALTSLIVITDKTAGRNGSYLADVDQGRNAIEEVSKTLRTAVIPTQLQDLALGDAAFIQGGDTSVQFYADLNSGQYGGPSKVTYSVVAGTGGTANLLETSEPPDQPVTAHNYLYTHTTTGINRTLARGLSWPSPVVFTYYDTTGTALTTPLTASQLVNVRTIDISVTVATSSGFSRLPTTYLQRVTLPNVDVLPNTGP